MAYANKAGIKGKNALKKFWQKFYHALLLKTDHDYLNFNDFCFGKQILIDMIC